MLPSALMLTAQFPEPNVTAVGGLYTHTGELFSGLTRLGCAMQVLTLPTPTFASPGAVGGGVHRVRPSEQVLAIPVGSDGEPTAQHLSLYSAELVAYVQRLVAETGLRPDVLHVHDFFLVPAALHIRRLLGIPVVMSAHILHSPLRAWWGSPIMADLAGLERMALHEVDAVIAVSHSMKRVMCESLGVPAGKVHVVHNGFDPAAFARAPSAAEAEVARRRMGLTHEHAPAVVYAGRLTRQKGVLPMLRAAARVLEEVPDAVFALAGPPLDREAPTDERRELFAQLAELQAAHPELTRQMRELGSLSRDELAHVYHVSAMAVIPSIYEPFGYAAVEALAAGLPVVASAVGGLPEILEHERTGLLVPLVPLVPPTGATCATAAAAAAGEVHRVDEDALAAAMIRLLRDRALSARLAAEGQRDVLTRFTREQMAAQTLDVYRSVARGVARAG
jgi:glycosyltransferase involved in cell wall biosynthesis